MRAHGAVDQKLKKIGAQHIPVVVVVGVALVAADHEATDAALGQECLVYREVGQVGFDGGALLGIKGLTGLKRIEGGRRIARVVGKRVRRQAWWQVVAHVPNSTRAPSGTSGQVDDIGTCWQPIG